jgi:hypothetical protein
MGGGGTRVEYKSPEIPKDDSFEKYLQYQQQKKLLLNNVQQLKKQKRQQKSKLARLRPKQVTAV